MLWLQLIAGVLAFGAGVVLLARVGAAGSRMQSPSEGAPRPSSWRRPWAKRPSARSFEDEVAELTEQLRKND